MSSARFAFAALLLLIASAVVPLAPAGAELVLSQLIVDLQSGKDARQDVEVWNNGSERAYVAVEPAEIMNPGTPSETRRKDPDPEKLGLLVSPARMILEPGERKLVRIANIAPPANQERVYRVTVKPVVGAISSTQSGLKVLVGYDLLVLVRPTQPQPNIVFTRSADTARFRNEGNVSVELVDGRECDAAGKNCTDLQGKRLYPGAQWSEPIKAGFHPEYTLKSPGQTVRKLF
jgi:P pilus assembly chaperone PapD